MPAIKKRKQSGLTSLFLSIAFFIVTVCIFGPFELFITNRSEFWFDIDEMLFISGAMSGMAILVLGGIGLLLRGKARSFFTALLFAGTMGLYAQSNFLNIDYGLLDGKKINWASYGSYAMINTAIWLILILAILVLWKVRNKLFAAIQKYASAALIAIQLLTLVLLFITNDITPSKDDAADYYLSENNLYSIGEENNFVIFVLDAFDEAYLQQLLSEDPDKYKAILDDFTHYTNAAAGGATTYAAMPIIISGQRYPGEVSYQEYVKKAFNSDGLYTELKNQGYSINFYTADDFVPGQATAYIDNLISGEYSVNSPLGFLKTYGKLTLYRQVPHLLKQFCWIYSDDLDLYRQGTSTDAPVYITDDIAFYKRLTEDKLQLIEGKTFSMIHTNGSHPPYNMDEFCQPAEESSPIEKSKGSLYLVAEYLDQMKALGVYDNSTVVIMADHGQETLSRGIVLIKKPFASGYAENDAPISHFDLHNTFFELLGKETGESIFDIPEDAQRTRMLYLQSSQNGTFSMTEYEISGHVRDVGNGTATGVVFAPQKVALEYSLGTKLTFGANGTISNYVEQGVKALQDGFAWTDNTNVVFHIPLADVPQHDLELELEYYTVYLEISDQPLDIFVDDTLLFSEVLSSPRYRTIRVTIPQELAKDKELNLHLALPNAIPPSQVFGAGHDPNALGLALTGLTINELDWSAIPEYSLGTKLSFGILSTVKNYVIQGLSESDIMGFGWTNGLETMFKLRLMQKATTDLQCTLNVANVLTDFSSQHVRISVNNVVCYENELTEPEDISFVIPQSVVESGNVDLRIFMPNAESPYEKTGEGDHRVLALALTGLLLEPANTAAQ